MPLGSIPSRQLRNVILFFTEIDSNGDVQLYGIQLVY
ncbi:MAG: hypothetical protein GFH27_549323n72 [Chloroflexi bacterium AL-W]|nr:hypothetical protein [Chloroflexi bacterium AL-N1]NOK70223.1 hypothetical protein [Chloroflexi bacterium AL-N10]NOK77760.1 hypothetical protein [Chloroflexi bacterium AL-N5]NOK84769.1 hypothetical protein [Chloroflexi bacterium AL-W]NOK92376.1 hypothetical protein [Chloroflexi bacterium AL-N15]